MQDDLLEAIFIAMSDPKAFYASLGGGRSRREILLAVAALDKQFGDSVPIQEEGQRRWDEFVRRDSEQQP